MNEVLVDDEASEHADSDLPEEEGDEPPEHEQSGSEDFEDTE